ncbi:PLC-like phosphodiesterase [Spinellus fusiger]|nr:PLC-like phosphodiesterase [Spinellus fusiger]
MYSRLALGAFLASVIAIGNAQQICNGYAELCNKPYNSLTYLLTHNSYAFSANPAANQLCPINSQLADGVRGLKLSAVKPTNATSTVGPNSISLCHTACSILDAGPAINTLSYITQWIQQNPNEVLTIMWNNLGDFRTEHFNALYQASGILDYSYVQPVGSLTWPTLQELITSGKRVINFLDLGADQGELPWLMSQFNYVFETPYNNQNESSFSCVIDRPTNPPTPASMMYVMNHFLYGSLSIGSIPIEIPQKGSANVTNADSLLKQSNTCTTTFGRHPNFLEIDFYNKGNTLQIAAQLNNVTYQPKTLQCDSYTSTTGSLNANQKNSASQAQYAHWAMVLLVVAGTLIL